MYFIHYLQLYSGQNRKGTELQEFVKDLVGTLISDDCSLDALSCDIQGKVAELNLKHTRGRNMIFSRGDNSIRVFPEGTLDTYVFCLSYSKVTQVYKLTQKQ